MFGLPPKAKEILKQLPKYIAIGVLVSVFLWFGVINQYLIAAEKSKFNAAERNIAYFADEIKQSVLMPVESAWIKECSYASQKYSRGPRSCSVSLHLLYIDKTYEDANNILSTIERKLNSSFSDKTVHGGKTRDEFTDPASLTGDQRFALIYTNNDCDNCTISINYPSRTMSGNPFNEVPENSIVISLSYSSSARTEHYPVND